LSGFAFKSKLFNDDGNGLPVVRIRDVVRGRSETFYSGDYDERYLVSRGDYLIGMDGEFNLARWQSESALLNQRVCKIDEISSDVDRAYLGRFLPVALKEIEDATPFVTVKHLSVKALNEIRIPLPPLAEQKRIAAILDAADALRAKRRESLAQLDTLLQSTFLELFGDPVTNPKGWDERSVQSVCRLVRGSSPRPKGDPRYYGGPVPRLMVGDISRDGFWVAPKIDSLTEEGATKSRPVPAGTVVMAVSGDVGVVATVQKPCCVHDGFVAFLDLNQTDFDSRFFMFQFHLLKMTHERRKAGAIFQNLTTKDIKAMRLPTPPLDLQHRFATIVESVERQKTRLRAHLAELDTLFASLQSRAFNGQL
jgi:restriction endonuclease S subunit